MRIVRRTERRFGWWARAEATIASLTQPRADVAASDAMFEHLFRQSACAAFGQRVWDMGERAWLDSRVRSVLVSVTRRLTAVDRVAQVRAGSAVVVVASLVAIGLQLLKPMAQGPLGWLLPALVTAVAAGAFLAAKPIAWALDDRTS